MSSTDDDDEGLGDDEMSESGTYTHNADVGARAARVDWFSLDSPIEEGEFRIFHGSSEQLHAERMLQRWFRKKVRNAGSDRS